MGRLLFWGHAGLLPHQDAPEGFWGGAFRRALRSYLGLIATLTALLLLAATLLLLLLLLLLTAALLLAALLIATLATLTALLARLGVLYFISHTALLDDAAQASK